MPVQLHPPRFAKSSRPSSRPIVNKSDSNNESSIVITPPPQPARNGVRGNRAVEAEILESLKGRIGLQKFEMWFAHVTLRIDDQRLTVVSQNQFAANWIEANFLCDLAAVASQALQRATEVVIEISAVPASNGSPASNGHNHEPTSLNGVASTMPPRFERPAVRHNGVKPALRRLDDFVVGSSNKLAYSAACRMAEDADPNRMSPLFIHGDCGVGKTHLLQGVCQRYVDRTGRSAHVRYVTGEQFTNEYITAIRANTIDAFRQKIRKLDLLAIDDVHFLSNKVRTQTEFLYTLDAIDLSGARVVLASDNHPHHIRRFNQALVSRFLSGMVVKVDRPDRALRIELVNRLAATRGLRINAAAVNLIADQCLGSVRELEGAITKLAAYKSVLASNGNGAAPHHTNSNCSSHVDEIGIVLAEQLFREQPWQGSHNVRMASIIEAVCSRLGVNKADVLGSGRHRRVVLARGLVAYLGRELTTHSFPEIAQSLGRSNHSTIHTADQRLRRQLEQNGTADLGGGESTISLKELSDQVRRVLLERRAA